MADDVFGLLFEVVEREKRYFKIYIDLFYKRVEEKRNI